MNIILILVLVELYYVIDQKFTLQRYPFLFSPCDLLYFRILKMNLELHSESSSTCSTNSQRGDDMKSPPVTFHQLEHTQAALRHLTCRAARELIPMGRGSRGSAPTHDSLRPALSGPNSERILLISSTESPMNAFKKLIDYGVQSAPVMDATTLRCSGLLDLRDLVSLVTLMEEEYQSTRATELKMTTVSHGANSTSLGPRSPGSTMTGPSQQRQSAAVPRAPPSPSRVRMQSKTVPTLSVIPPALPVGACNSTMTIPPTSLSNQSSYDSSHSSSSSTISNTTAHPPPHPPHPSHQTHLSHPSLPQSMTHLPSSHSITHTQNSHMPPLSVSGVAGSSLNPSFNHGLRGPNTAMNNMNAMSSMTPFSVKPAMPVAMHTNSLPPVSASMVPVNPAAYLGQVFNRMSVTRAVDHKPQDYSVTYLSARNRCVMISSDESLLTVISLLATTQDVHRVVVTEVDPSNPNRKLIVDIISQSDIVKILHALFGKYIQADPLAHEATETVNHDNDTESDKASPGFELQKSIDSLHLGTAPVLSVPIDATMFTTLQLLSTHKVSGVAVVDHQNKFVGNTSGADLKLYLQAPSSAKLHMRIMDFLGEVRRSGAPSNVRSPAVSVNPNSSLLYVIAKLTATGMHRVFVVDPISQAPIAVISVEDIVKLLHHGFPSRRVDRTFQRNSKNQPSSAVTTSASSSINSLPASVSGIVSTSNATSVPPSAAVSLAASVQSTGSSPTHSRPVSPARKLSLTASSQPSVQVGHGSADASNMNMPYHLHSVHNNVYPSHSTSAPTTPGVPGLPSSYSNPNLSSMTLVRTFSSGSNPGTSTNSTSNLSLSMGDSNEPITPVTQTTTTSTSTSLNNTTK